MNYYDEIKNELVNNEITKSVKKYSINRKELTTYYTVGKILYDAGKYYGETIIREYSKKLVMDLGKKYSERTLRRIRQFYLLFYNNKWSPVATKLSWSHYTELLSIKDENKLIYYLKIAESQNLSKRELRYKIKNKEYDRLDDKTKNKLAKNIDLNITDNVKNPILIKNSFNYKDISEKMLQKLIIENIESFMNELGNNFSFISSEYKIKIGDRYNYIDLLLFSIEFNCYVVVELKVSELKKEYIGQVEVYMNYIDKKLKKLNHDKTIGIIICKKDNKYLIEYCSDKRIISREYMLI